MWPHSSHRLPKRGTRACAARTDNGPPANKAPSGTARPRRTPTAQMAPKKLDARRRVPYIDLSKNNSESEEAMAVPPDKMKARVEAFEEVCRAEGLRRTPQRLAIFREVARSAGHPSAEEIFARVRKKLPTMSRDTVYRTLRLLERKDLVSTVGTLHERVLFDPNTDPHHHLICTRCGDVRDFYSDELDAYEPPEEVRHWGAIESMQAELRGTCSQCLRGEETAST